MKYLICTVAFSLLMMGCNNLNNDSISPNWTRKESKDQFTDKKNLVYLLKQPGKNSTDPLLAIVCHEDKRFSIDWMVDQKAPTLGGMDLQISMRVDDGKVIDEIWKWQSWGTYITPPDQDKFIKAISGAKKLVLRENITQLISEFDISGINKVIKETKDFCVK